MTATLDDDVDRERGQVYLSAMTVLGTERFGTGAHRVIVLNDWMSDTSSWDGARAYLDRARFTWAFTDLRGYGRSRSIEGSYTLPEAAADVLETLDALEWSRCSVVGHSMSALIALHLAQHNASRIERAVAITPPPPRGFGGEEVHLERARGLAMADRETTVKALRRRFGERLSAGWTDFKVERWRATAEPRAASAYVLMFGRDGLPDPAAPISIPVLAITGEQEEAPMRAAAVSEALSPFCRDLSVVPLADSGHYPMQETPPLLVAHVERFLSPAT